MNYSLEMAQALGCFDVTSFSQLYKEVGHNFSFESYLGYENHKSGYLGMAVQLYVQARTTS